MCMFCEIAEGEKDAKVVFEDDAIVAFRDIDPQAPTHLLVIPRKHVSSLAEAAPGDEALLGRLLLTARKVASQAGLEKDGYRVVINSGAGAGQNVFHIHAHVLGGRPLQWPPG